MADSLKIEIHQIFYNAETRDSLRVGYVPLDNTDGPTGWFEFWPILNYLRRNQLQEDVWYGFVSPRFPEKACVTQDEVCTLLQDNPMAEVALVSSYWQELALFRNPWLQGEQHHPGLIRCTEAFLRSIDNTADLRREITTFDTSVFSNYVIAKRRYWESWQELAERYLSYVNAGGADLKDNWPSPAEAPNGPPLRVFVQERLACRVLLDHQFHTVRPDYPAMTPRRHGVRRFPRISEHLYRVCDFSKQWAVKTDVQHILLAHRAASAALRRT